MINYIAMQNEIQMQKGVRNFQLKSNSLSHSQALVPFYAQLNSTITQTPNTNPLQSLLLQAKLAESVNALRKLPQSLYKNQKLLSFLHDPICQFVRSLCSLSACRVKPDKYFIHNYLEK